MSKELIMMLTIFVPVAGSAAVPFIGAVSARARNVVSLLLVAASVIGSFIMLPEVLSGKVITVSKTLPLGFNLVFVSDMLAVFMALVSSVIGSIIVYYSWGYIKPYRNQNEYYFMVVLFIGSMMGIVFSANLIMLFIFWEITALTSWRLIGFFREKDYVLKADKSFLVTVFGALMMLLGFVMIYGQAGSFDLAVIKQTFASSPVPNIAVILILLGILSKSATLPLHTWLPDAGVAPSPVTALLHAAVLVKIGVYVYARLFVSTINIADVWYTAVPVIAGASALVSAGAALVDTNLKRIIAYSTVSQIGFIFLGLSIGNETGIAGGLLYILMHGLAKGGLFLCAGIVEQKTHEKDITKLGGLAYTMPLTAVSFMVCSFSVMGIPPFGGFFAKYFVITGAVTAQQFWIASTFVAGAFLTIIYLLRVFALTFLGEPKGRAPKEGSFVMVSSVVALSVLSLAGGVYINYLTGPMQLTVQQMLGLLNPVRGTQTQVMSTNNDKQYVLYASNKIKGIPSRHSGTISNGVK
ncbi:MAG: NADH-quinone oxidoreductase subunit L [Endomicrobiales bacterium]|nr:NADH-quinone oxidoreductase subunit L [Endomicrobiales bacterium]